MERSSRLVSAMIDSVGPLTPVVFRLITSAMARWGGVSLPESHLVSFERRLRPRLVELGVRSFAEYFYHVVLGGTSVDVTDEMQRLFDLVVPHESYFMRELESLEWVVTSLRTARRPCTIWSAGCAHGQEPLSLLMLAEEHGLDSSLIRIIATDIGPRTVAQARLGRYSEHSLRAAPHSMQHRYFREVNGGGTRRWAIQPGLASRVAFHVGNLLDVEEGPGVDACDVILCRNVLLYFDPEARTTAVQMLSRQLCPGGLLVLGVSDRLTCGQGLQVEAEAPVNVYRRCES